MKYLKMIGLAAVAAMALMAFLGAGTASATVICHNNGQTNGCTEDWGLGDKGTFSLKANTTALLETTGGTDIDTCTQSHVEGEVERTGGHDAKGNDIEVAIAVTSLTWGNCTATTATRTKGTLTVAHTGTNQGTVTADETTVQVTSLPCYYTAGHIGTFTPSANGEDGILAIEATVTLVDNATHNSSGLCSASGTWTAEYTQTHTTKTYIATK